MKLTGDYHIHSRNCRFRISKSTIEEIARAANAQGLEEIAITDHGYSHFFAADKKTLLASRDKINEINMSLGTNVLLGVEADILSEDGTLDVDDETLAAIDLLIIGYHKMIKTDFASYFGKQENTHEAVMAATDAYVNAIKRYNVDIVAHPGAGFKGDLFRLGKVCADYDVLVELNNRHVDFSDEEMSDLLRSGCHFVVSSDAYGAKAVGKVDNVFKLIQKYDIPQDRIINVEFEHGFKSQIDYEIEQDRVRLAEHLKNKKKSQFEDTLSPEISAKLREIAKEKGLDLESDFDAASIDYKALLSDEERAVVERAEEYLKKRNLLK